MASKRKSKPKNLMTVNEKIGTACFGMGIALILTFCGMGYYTDSQINKKMEMVNAMQSDVIGIHDSFYEMRNQMNALDVCPSQAQDRLSRIEKRLGIQTNHGYIYIR